MVKLSADSLRHYEKLNLISPKRTNNQYRVYTEVEYRKVQYIKVLQYLGFSLSEVSDILKLDSMEVNTECQLLTDDVFSKKRNQIENIVNDYTYVLTELKKFIDDRENLLSENPKLVKQFTDRVVEKIFNRIIGRNTI